MVKIKFDVSGSDPDAAVADFAFEQPPVGLYQARLEELNTGYSKDGEGKPDKNRPRLECIYKLVSDAEGKDLDKNYSRVWDYVSLKSEAAEWKLDQFCQAMGLASGNKRKGTIDTQALATKADGEETGHQGKLVKLRVTADKDLDGNYRGRVGGVFAMEDQLDEDDELADVLEEDEEETSEEDVWTEEDIDRMKSAELKELVKEYEIEVPKGSKVADVKQLVKDHLFSEEDWEAEGDDEEGDELPF